jgi:hypothetical protein
LLPGENNLPSGCQGDSKATNFSSAVCFPTGEAGKNAETIFMWWFPNGLYRKQWVAKIKILLYIVKVIFSKNLAFKGTIRIFLNMLAVHIEGPRHPIICLFSTLYSCHCPLNNLCLLRRNYIFSVTQKVTFT